MGRRPCGATCAPRAHAARSLHATTRPAARPTCCSSVLSSLRSLLATPILWPARAGWGWDGWLWVGETMTCPCPAAHDMSLTATGQQDLAQPLHEPCAANQVGSTAAPQQGAAALETLPRSCYVVRLTQPPLRGPAAPPRKKAQPRPSLSRCPASPTHFFHSLLSLISPPRPSLPRLPASPAHFSPSSSHSFAHSGHSQKSTANMICWKNQRASSSGSRPALDTCDTPGRFGS